MPRKPRIDEPGQSYHVIARGIERRQIFRADADRDFFLSRLGALATETGIQIYAFALIPNHFHLLLKRNLTPLSTYMQRLLTSYAIYFNKKYRRAGHLFQNRYKAIMCESELHVLQLVRYIHLNPLKANLVESFDELDSFPYSGHALLLGNGNRAWFDPEPVLIHFGSELSAARRSYQQFVVSDPQKEVGDASQPEEPQFVFTGKETAMKMPREGLAPPDLKALISEVCSNCFISQSELISASKRRIVVKARALLAYRMATEMGFTGSEIGRSLSVTRSAAAKLIKKGSFVLADLDT